MMPVRRADFINSYYCASNGPGFGRQLNEIWVWPGPRRIPAFHCSHPYSSEYRRLLLRRTFDEPGEAFYLGGQHVELHFQFPQFSFGRTGAKTVL